MSGKTSVTVSNEQLVAEYAANRDVAVLDQIVRANQRLLHHILKRFAYADEPYEDLLQVANIGLIKAAQRFDGERGVRFATYAAAVVDGELRHHLRDTLLMRQPRWVKRVYAQIETASRELLRELGRPAELHELAARVNIAPEGILEVMSLYARVDLHGQSEPAGGDEPDLHIDTSRLRSLHAQSFSLPIEDRIVLQAALDKLSAFQ
ncbi:MAG: sigma-70 family RNA polymerase sigma factor, partial [Thermoleophilia bacterium]